MAAGFGLLRLSPKSFWSMTPRELERAMSVLRPRHDHAPDRAALAMMMQAFPDQRGTKEWPRT